MNIETRKKIYVSRSSNEIEDCNLIGYNTHTQNENKENSKSGSGNTNHWGEENLVARRHGITDCSCRLY